MKPFQARVAGLQRVRRVSAEYTVDAEPDERPLPCSGNVAEQQLTVCFDDVLYLTRERVPSLICLTLTHVV